MARLRHQYDHYNRPLVMDHGGSGIPSNQPATAKVLNIGCGSTYPVLATTSGNVLEVRSSFSHTSGDARSIYNALILTGSVGGESLRTITTVNSNLDTARGAHITLDFAATAGGSECSGLGTALTATLMIPNIASWAPTGTYASVSAEIYSWGTNSDPAGMTSLAFFEAVNAGHATGDNDVDTDAVFVNFRGGFTTTKDSGNMLMIEGDEPTWDNVTAYIKIRIMGTDMYLLAVPAIASD